MTTLKKIDKASPEGVENNLNIFDLPATNIAINKSSMRELLPLSAVNDLGPYVFRLFPDNQFVDMSKTWFYLTTTIERKDGNNWVPLDDTTKPEDKHVSVVQNFGHSFIKTLKITINGVECFDSGHLYAYRAYMLHELNYSHEVRKGLHEANCYYIDQMPQDHYDNSGLKYRAKRYANGAICETMVKLNFDMARQENLILNNSDIIFNIHRNSDDFLILAPDYGVTVAPVAPATQPTINTKTNDNQYRINVLDARLYVKCVDIVQSLNNTISRQLENVPAKYPLRKIQLRSVFLGKGRTEITHNAFTSIIPRRLVVGFVDNNNYEGKPKLSPFTFNHASVRSISVEANGITYPSSPYLFDFSKKKFVRAFVDMYAGLGMDDGEKTFSIDYNRFLNGWCFFVIPMTSTLEDTPGFELIRSGTTTVKVQFADPIQDDGYQMIILGEFDSIVSINKDRVLSLDGTI